MTETEKSREREQDSSPWKSEKCSKRGVEEKGNTKPLEGGILVVVCVLEDQACLWMIFEQIDVDLGLLYLLDERISLLFQRDGPVLQTAFHLEQTLAFVVPVSVRLRQKRDTNRVRDGSTDFQGNRCWDGAMVLLNIEVELLPLEEERIDLGIQRGQP